MTTKERKRLLGLRAMIEAMAGAYEDDTIYDYPELFEKWQAGKEYKEGARLEYENVVYKVLQAHTSQEGWTPSAAPSLFARLLIPDENIIPDWEQPDSTNAYMTGDKVRYNGKIYTSTIDNNVWSPDGYPAGWTEAEE